MKWLIPLLSIPLTWDMTSPAPGYRIHYTMGGAQFVGYSTTNRFTIQETLPRSYKVYVVATNQYGDSPKSRIVTVTNK
jgi:hypothetical protein